MTEFREGGLFAPRYPWVAPKKPILNRVKITRKATGLDFLPLKVIKFLSNVTNSHLYNIVIKELEKNKYSEESKTVLVRPIFQENRRNKIGNYWPGSILNAISKIYERCIAETISLNFISDYKKSDSFIISY